jgi:hypothetical protein
MFFRTISSLLWIFNFLSLKAYVSKLTGFLSFLFIFYFWPFCDILFAWFCPKIFFQDFTDFSKKTCFLKKFKWAVGVRVLTSLIAPIGNTGLPCIPTINAKTQRKKSLPYSGFKPENFGFTVGFAATEPLRSVDPTVGLKRF